MRICVLIVAFGILFAACTRRPVEKDLPKSEGNSVDHSRMRNSVIESSPNAESAQYELQFLDTMIAHHETAIDVAQLAPTRAAHQQLKDIAKGIITSDRAEIEQMRELRARFFPGASPAINADLPGITEAMKNIDLEKLDDLKENPFDQEFIRELVANREGAVAAAQNVIARSADSSGNADLSESIRKLAQTIIDSQNAEIKQLREIQGPGTK